MKNIIITGASSGIGMEFARQLARDAEKMLLIARRADRLESLRAELAASSGAQLLCLALDLTENGAYEAIADYLREHDFVPDCLINNAGAGCFGLFESSTPEGIRRQIELNISTPTLLSAMIIPMMSAKADNAIVNVSSTFAFRKCPQWSVYAASKSYIFHLTRSLQMETFERNIHFSLVCPGRTESEFRKRAGAPESPNGRAANASQVVAYSIKQIKRKKKIIVPGAANKAKRLIFGLLPEFLTNRLIK